MNMYKSPSCLIYTKLQFFAKYFIFEMSKTFQSILIQKLFFQKFGLETNGFDKIQSLLAVAGWGKHIHLIFLMHTFIISSVHNLMIFFFFSQITLSNCKQYWTNICGNLTETDLWKWQRGNKIISIAIPKIN